VEGCGLAREQNSMEGKSQSMKLAPKGQVHLAGRCWGNLPPEMHCLGGLQNNIERKDGEKVLREGIGSMYGEKAGG